MAAGGCVCVCVWQQEGVRVSLLIECAEDYESPKLDIK